MHVQVDSLDARLATMAGQDEAASSAQGLLRSQLATARAEAKAAEERSGAARAAQEAKGQECARCGVVYTCAEHNELQNVHMRHAVGGRSDIQPSVWFVAEQFRAV